MSQTPTFDLRLPRKSGTTGTGIRTVYTPPNYVPPPESQRINDAVAEARDAKAKLQAAETQVKQRLDEDNVLHGELQTEIDRNQQLQDQLNASMATPHRTPDPSPAAKAAASDVDQLSTWANKQP